MPPPSRYYGAYNSNTNSSLFKFAIAAAGFFAGALVGAYMPDLILKPAKPSSLSHPAADADDEPLCTGPECASSPPPKLPASAIPLPPVSPYEASRLTAVRATAASSASVGDLEVYALLLHYEGLHAQAGDGAVYADATESLPALLTHLTGRAFDVAVTSSTVTLSSLRALAEAGALVLTRVQVGGEGRWLAVVAVSAYNVYALDPYTSGAVVWMPTRAFVSRWWETDSNGNRQSSVSITVKPPAASAAAPRSAPTPYPARLVELKLDASSHEHAAVNMASL